MNWTSLTYTTLTVVLSIMSGCRSPSSGAFQPAMSIAPPAVSYQGERPVETLNAPPAVGYQLERPAESYTAPKAPCGPGCRSCPGGSISAWFVPDLLAPPSG
jgi:hypothetical protein